jgi:excisionase family DNA binding protein
MTDSILVPINQGAAIIGRSRRTTYGLIAAGVLKAVKSGRSTLLVYESLEQYAASLPAAKIKLDDRARRHVREAA